MKNIDLSFVAELESIVSERLEASADESYTARLAGAGTKRIAQKVGEEGVELALAAVSGQRDEIINEAADLLYHMIVLLTHRHISLADVAKCLESRHAERRSKD